MQYFYYTFIAITILLITRYIYNIKKNIKKINDSFNDL